MLRRFRDYKEVTKRRVTTTEFQLAVLLICMWEGVLKRKEWRL